MNSETAVVLFTDVVGSTVLATSLSPEAADALRRDHFSTLRQAIAEFGGLEVKNLGDGLMVVFTSASSALSCAAGMQQAVEWDGRGREHPVGLRVGLSGGEVTHEAEDYFGDPVVEAARLCGLCEGGQILASDIVRAMAGRHRRQECVSRGAIVLKGIPDPVDVFEVQWTPLPDTVIRPTVPLPIRLTARPDTGVIGRQVEISRVVDAVKRVADGPRPEVVLVSGEAGIGKTTVVAEAARIAFEGGACVLFGHCEEDLAFPYQLFAETLGHYVKHADEGELLEHVETYGSELVRLVPALASRLPDLPPSKASDADSERYLLFAAVVGLLAEASRDQPLVLVTDDLQWADKGSLQLLQHCASSELPMRVVVVGTYRDNELSHADALVGTLGGLHRLGGVSRVDLTGFDNDSVFAYMEAAAGQRLDASATDLAQAVRAETDGNPFFVSEVFRHLAETGAIFRDDNGRWVPRDELGSIALPDSVREVIGSRIVRLGDGGQRILSLAAVIGRDFDFDVLSRATRASEDDLLDVLDAAAAVSLVREMPGSPGWYCFSHALIQHTLYEDLGPTRRARSHRIVAEAIEDLCGGDPGSRVGELAHHWFSAAQPMDMSRALDYSRRAADAALAALAPGDAIPLYRQALNLAGLMDDTDPRLELELGIGLGNALRQTGDASYRRTLVDVAHRAADRGVTDCLVSAALANSRGFYSAVGQVDADKVRVLEMALDRVSSDHPSRALLLASLFGELVFGTSLERRQSLAEEALALAEASGDETTIVRVLHDISVPIAVPSLFARCLTRSAEGLRRASQLGDPLLVYWAAARRSGIVAADADIEELDRCLEIGRSTALALDEPTLNWLNSSRLCARSILAGDTDRAEELAGETFRIGTEGGEPDAALIYGSQLMALAFQRGSLGDFLSAIEDTVANNPNLPVYLATLALAYADVDRTEEARSLLEEFAAKSFELPLDLTWLLAMSLWAEAAIECQDPAFAGPLFDRLLPCADMLAYVEIVSVGPVSHFLGGLAAVLERYGEASDYFSRASAMNERTGARFFAARTNLSWGRMLLGRGAPGDAEQAWDLLTKAHDVAATHGYENVRRRAATSLHDSGREVTSTDTRSS